MFLSQNIYIKKPQYDTQGCVRSLFAAFEREAHWHLSAKMCLVTDILKYMEAETKHPIFSKRHFQSIFLNENVWLSIKISLEFLPEGSN